MNWEGPLLQHGLKAVNEIGQRYYPKQKELLDELRQENYALVVFDALRYDVAKQLLPLYIDGELQPAWSSAHDTFQYGHRCWGDRVYQDTYLTGAAPLHANPTFEDEFFQSLYGGWKPGETMHGLVEAFRDCWDTSLGTCNPEQLTDYAHDYVDCDQLAVHYFQPHAPYIGRCSLLGHNQNEHAQALTGDPIDKPIWERFKAGEISPQVLRRAYISNAQRGIEAALPLLERLCEQDRQVVVMADHGEMLGQVHRRLVSHPRMSFPQIRRVPWMEVNAVREHPDPDRAVDGSMKEKLEALGYK